MAALSAMLKPAQRDRLHHLQRADSPEMATIRACGVREIHYWHSVRATAPAIVPVSQCNWRQLRAIARALHRGASVRSDGTLAITRPE